MSEPSSPQQESQNRARRQAWIAWGVFAALVGVLAVVSLRACGASFLGGVFARDCPAPSRLSDNARMLSLREEMHSLERQLGEAKSCSPQQQAQTEAIAPCSQPPPGEVVVSVDVSPSMEFCLDTSLAREAELDDLARRMQADPLQQALLGSRYEAMLQSMRCNEPRRRLDFARKALADLVAEAGPTSTFVLQSFSACGAPRTHGRYAPDQRREMLGQIRGLRTSPNTALADAVKGAAAGLRGGRTPDDPATIIIVSDGSDSCGGDPCAAAQQVKRDRPYARIHVVTVGGNVAVGRCIAEATGGRVFEARNPEGLAQAVAEASGQRPPSSCTELPGPRATPRR